MSLLIRQIGFVAIALACLFPFMTSGIALLVGILFAVLLENPFPGWSKTLSQKLLQASVIGLGAGMNLHDVGQAGVQGLGYTFVGIILILAMGMILGRVFRTDKTTSLLISVGTAICGGSAIAAVASAIRAKSSPISVSLATVFFLNAMALFVFPSIGQHFMLSAKHFGLWSALAIHDTSSVIGAALQYDPASVESATTVKLARAIWIIPVTFLISAVWKDPEVVTAQNKQSVKKPWFILGFLVAAALVTWVPQLRPLGSQVTLIAKRVLVLTLFLIGSGLTRDAIRSVGVSAFIQGFVLWILAGSITLFAILGGIIQ